MVKTVQQFCTCTRWLNTINKEKVLFMAKEQKATGKVEHKSFEHILKDISVQIHRIIDMLECMKQRQSGGF